MMTNAPTTHRQELVEGSPLPSAADYRDLAFAAAGSVSESIVVVESLMTLFETISSLTSLPNRSVLVLDLAKLGRRLAEEHRQKLKAAHECFLRDMRGIGGLNT